MRLHALKEHESKTSPPFHFSSNMAAADWAGGIVELWYKYPNGATSENDSGHCSIRNARVGRTPLVGRSKCGERMSGRFSCELWGENDFLIAKTSRYLKKDPGRRAISQNTETYRMSQGLGDIINSLPFPRLSCAHFQSNGFEMLQRSPLAVKERHFLSF